MLNPNMLYNIIYALAAVGGREAKLFGNYSGLAYEAFTRSNPSKSFPEVWFELPLLGDPWLDLHVLTARHDLEPGMLFSPQTTGGYPEAFSWFASEQDVRQLALSYDVHTGDIDNPAIQLLVNDQRKHRPFLELVGGKSAVDSYVLFERRLPEEWFACYSGLFPNRPESGVRVECIPSNQLQCAYVEDPALLEKHLLQVGLRDVAHSIVPACRFMADKPFTIEFQFNVLPDGTLSDTFSASSRFAAPIDATSDWQAFSTSGAAEELMEWAVQLGVADERWRLMADTMFAKKVTNDGKSVVAYCCPTFFKMRWRAGEPLDAKAYIVAGLQ